MTAEDRHWKRVEKKFAHEKDLIRNFVSDYLLPECLSKIVLEYFCYLNEEIWGHPAHYRKFPLIADSLYQDENNNPTWWKDKNPKKTSLLPLKMKNILARVNNVNEVIFWMQNENLQLNAIQCAQYQFPGKRGLIFHYDSEMDQDHFLWWTWNKKAARYKRRIRVTHVFAVDRMPNLPVAEWRVVLWKVWDPRKRSWVNLP